MEDLEQIKIKKDLERYNKIKERQNVNFKRWYHRKMQEKEFRERLAEQALARYHRKKNKKEIQQ